ncbi:MAG: HAMP domain-containing sensor histidine kinase [Clostridia bacterium]|nr:HAMP domain-containing sensor histidine kinase [Clostridia bacterium]
MITKLRIQFIRIAMAALASAMILAVAAVNIANWVNVQNDLHETLTFLTESTELPSKDDNGSLPKEPNGNSPTNKRNKHVRNMVSESRWCSVIVRAEDHAMRVNLHNVEELDEAAAEALARQVLTEGKPEGFHQQYLYLVKPTQRGETRVVMLNCETKLNDVQNLATFSGIVCVAGMLLALLFVSLASKKAIEPTLNNIRRQKEFITNAGHELKTPLTVITTNTELLQMELPDNRWLKSTQKQAAQLRHLVDEMVYLSRMEEENAPIGHEPLNFSALLEEAADPFAVMAEFQGKTMDLQAEPSLNMQGDAAAIKRLISTLMDNAVKYAPEGGTICVEAFHEGRQLVFRVSNDVSAPLTESQCSHLFDRFYRADAARSKEGQSGFGIGLSIAAAIVEKHSGTIRAAMEGHRLVIVCKLPKG